MRLILGLVALVGLCAPAFACVNDRETPKQEREFRSNYGDPTPKPAPEPEAEPYRPRPAPSAPVQPLMVRVGSPALMGVGAVLLTGACVVAVRQRGRA